MKSLLLIWHSQRVHPWSKTTALSQYLVFLNIPRNGRILIIRHLPVYTEHWAREYGFSEWSFNLHDSHLHEYSIPCFSYLICLKITSSLTLPAIFTFVLHYSTACLNMQVQNCHHNNLTLPLLNPVEEGLLISMLQAYSLKWFNSFFFPTSSSIENRQKSNTFHSVYTQSKILLNVVIATDATLSL